MLSETYNKLFRETLQNFAINILSTEDNDLRKKQYCLFYPTIGRNYVENSELLVIGQATNGWCPKFVVSDVQTNHKKLVTKSIKYSSEAEGKCPLEWVNEKWIELKLFRSFFWNVTYKLVKAHYYKTDDNWNNIIAWSNLMKIAPVSGNPNSWEIEAQVDNATILFKQELDDLKPKNVLIITNLEKWAKPILEKSKVVYEVVNGEIIEAIGNYNKTKIIVTKRPYIGGKHQPFIDEIRRHLVI